MPEPKKSKAGIIERKRENPTLPDWAKNPEKYQYKKSIGKHKYIETPPKTKMGKPNPTEYYDKRKKDAIKKALTTEW